MDVRRPFKFGRVRMACANVTSLELLKLLLCAKLVGLEMHSSERKGGEL